MSPVFQAALQSWSIPPAATFVILLTALVYLRGWRLMRRAGLLFVPPWRALAFLAGLLLLWVALASPMDVLNGFVLTAHMLQHMLLMMFVPPLLLLGAPFVPLVRGLPIFAAREFVGPFLNWSIAHRVGGALTHPVVALLLMGLTMFAWHVPAAYELALRVPAWHQVEHACFLLTSLIFWWPVVQPWPSRARWPRAAMVPYLLVADLQNTVLSAVLVFSDRVLYPSYSTVPRLFGSSALQDQVAAGAIMWVIGSFAFLVPAIAIALQYLSSKPEWVKPPARREPSSLDALLAALPNIPVFSNLLRRRFSPGARQAIWFVIVFVVVGLLFARLWSTPSDEDDQALRFRHTSGPFTVAVFAQRELDAGAVSLSVLVQDRSSDNVLLNAIVDLAARQTGQTRPRASVQASYAESDNKLLQSANLDLPAVGEWMVDLTVRQNSQTAEFSFPLQLAKPARQIEFPWSYAAVLLVGILLYSAYVWRHRNLTVQPPIKCGAAAS